MCRRNLRASSVRKTRKIIDGKIYNDIMDIWLFEYDGEVDLGNATTDESGTDKRIV